MQRQFGTTHATVEAVLAFGVGAIGAGKTDLGLRELERVKPRLFEKKDVPEILGSDLQSERGAQATLQAGIAHCESVRDYVSRELLEDILTDTEEHIDWLETQLDLLNKVGLQNYLQSAMGEPA